MTRSTRDRPVRNPAASARVRVRTAVTSAFMAEIPRERHVTITAATMTKG